MGHNKLLLTTMMMCRTESRTFLCSETRIESIPCVEGVKGPGKLGNWMSPEQVIVVVVIVIVAVVVVVFIVVFVVIVVVFIIVVVVVIVVVVIAWKSYILGPASDLVP